MALQVVPDSPPVRALIYTRVSQDRAGGRSPAEQEADGRAVCEHEGWSVVEVVTDSVGASRHSKGKRAGWARAQQLLADGAVDVLVTWAASRAQRDLEAYAELRRLCSDAGVLWSYGGRTYDLTEHDDRFRTGLDALLAEREADEIAFNVRRAIRANAVAGRPHGRRLFGYTRVYDPQTGALVGQEPDPVEAGVVVRIVDLYLAGTPLKTIARALNADGVTTGTGARWADTQVHRVLTNPAYAARRVHKGEVIGDAGWPAIVEPDRFDRVQARLAARRTNPTRQIRAANLLSGVARCGVCLGPARRGHDRNRRKTYVCVNGAHVARDLARCDAWVTRLLLERLARPDVHDLLDPAEPPAELAAARAELDACRARLADAVAEFTAGRITAATVGMIEADLQPRVKAAEQRVRRSAVPIDIDVPEPARIDHWWDHDLTPEQRRAIVGAFIDRVVIHPVGRGRRSYDPNESLTVSWRA
ncbi:MAG TPA: recombinase family protein [Acidimicrobiales bacterium]|nr:recombinase family protein [Acidimicrobiales bacterium]